MFNNNRLTSLMAVVIVILAAVSSHGQHPIDLRDGVPIQKGGGFTDKDPSHLVVLKVRRGPYLEWVGTGFFLDNNTVLSCHHNVRDMNQDQTLSVQLMSGKTYRNLRTVKFDAKLDLLLIQILDDVEPHRHLLVSDDSKESGTVFTEGFVPSINGVGRFVGNTTGSMLGVPGVRGDVSFLHTSNIVPGMSGGPTLNSLGRVVGVNLARYGDQGISVKLSRIQTFLRESGWKPREENHYDLGIVR